MPVIVKKIDYENKKRTKDEKIIEARKKMPGKRAIIWTSVSSAEQYKTNNSIATQVNACKDFCEHNSIEVIGIYEENESAKVAGERFIEMISNAISDERINTVVVYDFDRFSRNSEEGIAHRSRLSKAGISLLAVNQPIAQDSLFSSTIENLMMVVANMDNEMRKHKCTEGMKSCLERGEWYSCTPLGYDSKKVGKHHIITINETGLLLREAFRWKADDNIKSAEIVSRLNARGLRINKQQVSKFLHNPFYCGKIRHRLLGD